MIVSNRAPQELKNFAAHALHVATRWQIGDIELRRAASMLRRQADSAGLIRRYGDGEIEWIIGWAFAELGVHYGEIRP